MLDLRLEYEYMQHDIDAAIKQCLEHQRWILGPEVKELENKIAEYLGVKHCIGACSGTESLVLSLRALAIKLKGQEFFDKSDEILTTSFTFTATGDAILRAGATPVFIDIDPKTYNIDINKLEEYLSASSGVVGIMPVHLYGQACDMDKVMALAEKHNLFVIEDVAQGFGGGWKGRKLGTIGNTGSFSFFPAKNLGCYGDGGIVSTDDDKVAEIIRMLIKHGGRDKYNVDHVGYNARLDTLQAAIVLAKFKYIDEFNSKRKQLAALYSNGLKDVKGIALTETLADADHVFHQYTIRVLDGKRDELQAALKEKGVSTMIYYPYPLHKMKVFGEGRSKSAGSLEHSETAADSVLSLPMEPLQSAEDAEYVIDCIKQCFGTQ
jgi:dTDP-4-amino-4,6-dideoxygalactose transaminase